MNMARYINLPAGTVKERTLSHLPAATQSDNANVH